MNSILSINEYSVSQWKLPNGKLHREDGPALESNDGIRAWYKNGYYHREDGPAVEYSNGDKLWCLEGVKYTKINYRIEMRSIKLKQLL